MVYETIGKIDLILKRVNTHPYYSKEVENETRRALLEDSRRHSLYIEGAEGEEEYARLNAAEEYLCENGLTLGVLASLGNIIDPVKNPSRRFRLTSSAHPSTVRNAYGLDELRVEPPHHADVPQQIKSLLDYLEKTDAHPVVRAAEAHLEYVRIHPHFEGNGRAARVLQNFCLSEFRYPAPVIPSSQRGFYKEVIQEALAHRVSDRTSPETENVGLFREFIALEVLKSMNHLERELEKNRAYSISLPGVDVAVAHTIANKIRSLGRSCKTPPLKVRVDKKTNGKRGPELQVIGDVGSSRLNDILANSKPSRGKFHYEISPLGR